MIFQARDSEQMLAPRRMKSSVGSDHRRVAAFINVPVRCSIITALAQASQNDRAYIKEFILFAYMYLVSHI